MEIEWDEFESLLFDCWAAAMVKQQFDNDLKISSVASMGLGCKAEVDEKAGVQTQRRVDMASSAMKEGDRIDKKKNCVKCGKDFMFTVKQQMRAEGSGRKLEPDWCHKCRGQVCDAFQKDGSCSFGEDCIFLHEKAEGAEEQEAPRRKYPCRFFEAGRCDKGDSCPFSHDEKAKAGP